MVAICCCGRMRLLSRVLSVFYWGEVCQRLDFISAAIQKSHCTITKVDTLMELLSILEPTFKEFECISRFCMLWTHGETDGRRHLLQRCPNSCRHRAMPSAACVLPR